MGYLFPHFVSGAAPRDAAAHVHARAGGEARAGKHTHAICSYDTSNWFVCSSMTHEPCILAVPGQECEAAHAAAAVQPVHHTPRRRPARAPDDHALQRPARAAR
jgi:hypothetical protein